MSERIEGPGELDARLAEFDRRLREIQVELLAEEGGGATASVGAMAAVDPAPLEPGTPPEPASAPVQDPPRQSPTVTHGRAGPLAELLAQLRAAPDDYSSELGDLRELVSSVRELLGGIETVLARLESCETGSVRHEPEEATIAAGPFTTIEAVRAFERDVAALPGVEDAAVRGYEGAARAIIDVRLGAGEESHGADL